MPFRVVNDSINREIANGGKRLPEAEPPPLAPPLPPAVLKEKPVRKNKKLPSTRKSNRQKPVKSLKKATLKLALTSRERSQSRKQFGQRLTEAMKYRKLTADVVAKTAGLTRQTLWRYETGATKADLVNVIALASTLRVRFEWLATGKGPMLDPACDAETGADDDVRAVG